MAVELSPHLGVFLAAVIVEDDMDDFAGRDLGLDRIEKTDEFLVPVAPHAAADHPAFEYIEGGKTERGAAVALVVISYRPIVPQRPVFSGKPGCVRSSRLDLRFLID